jgi:hypothetical protein
MNMTNALAVAIVATLAIPCSAATKSSKKYTTANVARPKIILPKLQLPKFKYLKQVKYAEDANGDASQRFVKGSACKKANGKAGVKKVDACGRLYCGLTSVTDIIERSPNIAKMRGCTWKIDGTRCVCSR